MVRFLVVSLLSLVLIQCKKSNSSSETKFFDLKEKIDVWSEGESSDVIPPSEECSGNESQEDSTFKECTSSQVAELPLFRPCGLNSDPENIQEETGFDYTNLSLCYEAEVGFRKVLKGHAKGEFETVNSQVDRKIKANLKVDGSIFSHPIDVGELDLRTSGKDLDAGATISLFGKEIWSQRGEFPRFNISYMGDHPQGFDASYGFPIPGTPTLKASFEVTGDVFFGVRATSVDSIITGLSRLAGAAYVRPHATASLGFLGFNPISATVGGFAQLASEDLIHKIDLEQDFSISLTQKAHETRLMEGSIYTEAKFFNAHYWHFFFNHKPGEEKSSCEVNSRQAFCPCTSLVSLLEQGKNTFDIYHRDEANPELNEVNNPNGDGLVCNPVDSKWMVVSEPLWQKSWPEQDVVLGK